MNLSRKEQAKLEERLQSIRSQAYGIANMLAGVYTDYGVNNYPEILQYLQDSQEELQSGESHFLKVGNKEEQQ